MTVKAGPKNSQYLKMDHSIDQFGPEWLVKDLDNCSDRKELILGVRV